MCILSAVIHIYILILYNMYVFYALRLRYPACIVKRMWTIRAQYILYLYKSIEAARGPFKNNTTGGLYIAGIDEVSDRVSACVCVCVCVRARLSCGSAVIYFRLHGVPTKCISTTGYALTDFRFILFAGEKYSIFYAWLTWYSAHGIKGLSILHILKWCV
jgi:hypothetical protein